MRKDQSKVIALIFLIIAPILWGLNFHLAKYMLKNCSALEASFWRYLFASIILGIVCVKNLPEWKLVLASLKPIFLLGGIGLFGFSFFFFTGLNYTSAINGSLILSLIPALTIILASFILSSRITYLNIIGILIGLMGVTWLIIKGDINNLINFKISSGDILFLIAASLFALYNVWVKKYLTHLTIIQFTFFTNLACLILLLSVLPFTKLGTVQDYQTQFWLSAIMIGGAGTALAYILWNKGIKIIGASIAGIFMNIVPLSTSMFSLLFGEELHSFHLISGFFIIVGVIVMNWHSLSAKKN